ncbi:MAG: hypothetical protein H7Y07_06310 [Pyrinomonadaceae bacterium]|nr:hypothetical protein [Sphingobacteriaceae bacterium]
MKKFSLLLLMLPSVLMADDLVQIRKQYYAALTNQKAADKLYKELKSKTVAQPIIMAYFGSVQALRAKHAFNPYNKVSYLKSGLKTLDASVSKSPENLEIRYLRFTLEYYIPSFLGYSKHLETDRKKIIELSKQKKFGAMDKPLLQSLLGFMKETKQCSLQEIASLDQAINNG